MFIKINQTPAKNIGDILKRKGYAEIELLKSGEDRYSDTNQLKGSVLYAPVGFEGMSGIFLVDTGFLYTTLNSLKVKKSMWWRRNYFPGYRLKDAMGNTQGVAGVCLDNFKIGSFDAGSNVDVGYQELNLNDCKDSKNNVLPVLGIIGVDILYRNNAVIDFGNSKLYLKR